MKFKVQAIGIALSCAINCFGQSQQTVSLSDIKLMEAQDRAKLFSTLTPIQLSDPNDFFNVMAQGITDTDASVRKSAAGKAAYVMVGLQQRKQQGQSMPISAESFSIFQNALVSALNDPDSQTRMASAGALVYSDAPNEAIESALIGYFRNESDFLPRISVAKEMRKAGYESSVVDAQILEGLGNPDSQVRMEAARAAGSTKVAGALPKLALLLSDKEIVKGHVVDAIAAYGSEAKPYLSELQAILASGNAGGTLARDIAKAIETIKNPPPQGAVKAQIKPVSLVDTSSPTPPTAATTATPAVTSSSALANEGSKPAPAGKAEPLKSTRWPWIIGSILLLVVAGGFLFKLRRK